MKSLNRVALIGHLASDVDFRTVKGDFQRSTFPVATNRNVKGDDGEVKDHADYHRIVSWGKLADVVRKYLKKGMAVYVEGKLVNSSYESKSGEKHFRTEVIADNLNILSWKKSKKGDNEINIEDLEQEVNKKKAKK